jgi:uncharacterized protein DUF1883
MNFLHTDFNGGPEKVVVVTLDGQANVMLLDDHAFSSYRSGSRFTYHGGWATKSPVQLRPSSIGHWHVVVDLGGRAGQVRAGIRIVGTAA